MEHLWDLWIQLCANKVPWVINGPAPVEDFLMNTGFQIGAGYLWDSGLHK